MKIDICLTATNTNSIYIDQIPTFIKIWQFFDIEPRIILVNHEIPPNFLRYSDYIILFDPAKNGLEKLETAFIAQNIRIFYPALLPTEKTVMISDIDIMPISRHFFLDSIKSFDYSTFVNYRRYNGQLNICYNLARASIWSQVFNIFSIEDVVKNLLNSYNDKYDASKNCPGWFTDQEILTKKVMEYQRNSKNPVIFLDKLGFKIHRLDKRDRKELIVRKKEIIKNIGYYTDFHMTSKNQRYISLSNEIKEAIFKHLEEDPRSL